MDTTIFEYDEYDFDKELDFELMGIEIFNVNEAGDPPSEILEKLEKHENKQTPNIEETEDVNLGTNDEPREVKIGTGLSWS